MPPAKPQIPLRLKVLRAIRLVPQRYDRFRALTMTASLGLLLGVPLSGLARVDLWRGHHALLFREATLGQGLTGVVVGIAALYVVTFMSNVVMGRMFCGWGCPVGQVSRFGEGAGLPGLKPRQRFLAHARGAIFSAALVLSFLAWWVDLTVLWRGSGAALWLSWSLVAAGVAAAWAHGRYWRWKFCMQVCPIGLYYSFVSTAKWFGIHFRNQTGSCIECDACDHVCPVDLKPRELVTPLPARGGLSIPDAPGRNHCLECGDCVRACEFMIAKRGQGPVPLHLGYYAGAQSIERSGKIESLAS